MDKSRSRSQESLESEGAARRRPVSVQRIRIAESELEQRARQIGTAAGTVVALLRDARRKLNERDLWKTTNPLSDLRTTARGRAQELRHTAAFRAQEWRRAALERIGASPESPELGRLRALGRAKGGRREIARPMIVAAGVLGFLLGAGLKAWRNR